MTTSKRKTVQNDKKQIREEKLRLLRRGYSMFSPLKKPGLLAMRKTYCDGLGTAIELIYSDKTFCYIVNEGWSKKETQKTYYVVKENLDDILDAFRNIIPRLEDRTFSRFMLQTTVWGDSINDDIVYNCNLDKRILKEFLTFEELDTLDPLEYEILENVLIAWYGVDTQFFDPDLYTNWKKTLEPFDKMIAERIKIIEKQEKEKKRKEIEQKRKEEAEKRKEEERKQKEEIERKREEERIEREKALADLHAWLDQRHAEEERLEAEKKEQIIAAGKRGEEEVEYALKWIDNSYHVLHGKDGKIEIENKDFINESQEIDHIVVGPEGIILIETKAYSGDIYIDKNGNWYRVKNDEKTGMKNPIQQVRRHEKLIRSFVPQNIPIQSYICIANSKATITGSQNSSVPIIKSDLLVEKIENSGKDSILSQDEIQKLIDLIRKHMI